MITGGTPQHCSDATDDAPSGTRGAQAHFAALFGKATSRDEGRDAKRRQGGLIERHHHLCALWNAFWPTKDPNAFH